MKLRYLRLQRSRPPLRDLILTFPQDRLLSAQPLTLRFVVGLNGSGKTTLLQTLAEIFVSLDRDGQPPAFPLWLAYDLQIEGKLRTIYLCAPRSQPPALVVFEQVLPAETDWEILTSLDPRDENKFEIYHPLQKFTEALPGSGDLNRFLPSALLAYTSGETRAWETLFAPTELFLDESAWAMLAPEFERPNDWDVTRENELRQKQAEDQPFLQPVAPSALTAQLNYPTSSFLIGESQLTLASTLVMLQHLANQGQNTSLQAVLDKLHFSWKTPLAFSLWVNLDPVRLDPNRAAIIVDLMKLAVNVVREPEPGQWRQLVFDPLLPVPEKDYNANQPPTKDNEGKIIDPGFQRIIPGDLTTKALLALLGGESGQIFDVFRTLSDWQQNSLVRDVRLVLHKDEVDDALLLNWLSDGERMFLGRVALFYLLRDKQDALLILDEPETHFNDAWKRRLVDMLDDALRDSAHQVIISTHSGIVLSDVFNTEITVFKLDGTVYESPQSGTFGTLPSEIMSSIFDTQSSIGDRAKEFLSAVFTLVEYPDLANGLWKALDETPDPDIDSWLNVQHPFGNILQIFSQREQEQKLPHREHYQWLRLFQGLHRRAQVNGPVTLASVLEMLFEYVGAGYYQFELRRQHHRLTKAGENASSS
jgi:predicted ATPase